MKDFLWKIYAYKFFDDFVLIYPLYAVMFTDFSMQPWQVGVLLGVWSVTSLLFEVPSGVWADMYSRKNILFLGQLIRVVGYAIWLLYPTFWGFAAGFVLWGIKSALTSGTFQALIYDELIRLKQEQQFTKVYGRAKTLSFIAIVCASLGASFAIHYGYQVVLLLSCFSVVVSGFAVLQLPQVPIIQSTHEKEYFSLLKEGVKNITNNKVILKIVMFLAFVLSLGGALDEYWPIFAHEVHLPDTGLGILLAIISGVQACASYVAYKFSQRSNMFFYALFTLNGIFLFCAAYIFEMWVLIFLVIFGFLFTIVQIVFEGKLQDIIESATRATVSSINGFLTEVGVIIVYVLFGAVSQVSTYQIGFIFFACVIMVIGAFMIGLSIRSKNNA
ncbi:MFS transporter [bacterium]|uniref:Major facilitator superfamily (MFS) profile domain-containing protein n=2 Tax=Katanobacteria TaxID=422282 RepID=A0A2M7X193_UNCKA|nr:MFS transporter [bacterium]PIP56566.1 MAG: hypothetical protein COX05_02530 [candidate division WWE3 bacterium CG22_combo_CG10-13_8_21_14_all_39_12]PJA39898.1 MAG: hypothetical protein CO179_04005 [candidate division WWE3 bacterium CG_4_9_14_3_um_filter_39_7]